jgi:hypothetical protein
MWSKIDPVVGVVGTEGWNGTWQYTLPGRMKTGDQGLNELTVPSQERNGGIRDV